MKKVHLQHLSEDGKIIEATFSPSHGMNLLSLKKDGLEYIDQNTLEEFKRRRAGLGALIGPHFYHRKNEAIPEINLTDIFSHVDETYKSTKKEPLSHGIGRYVPWNYNETSTSIEAHLSGLDAIEHTTLASIEGFPFSLDFSCKLTSTGLFITYSVQSEKSPSTIGLHYYLALPEQNGIVTINCLDKYNDLCDWKDIPDGWKNENGEVAFNLENESDYGFRPNSTNNSGLATLTTSARTVKISYKANSEQHAFQLYHPKDATFVCIEPVSAIDPRNPEGTKHKLEIAIDLL